MKLYHTSPTILTEIKEATYTAHGIDFEGIFAADDIETALAHHDVLHEIEIEDEKVLTCEQIKAWEYGYEDDSELKMDQINAILKQELQIESNEDLDLAHELVLDQTASSCYADYDEERALEIFRASDDGEMGWEAQALLGKIAKKLGYQAVEIIDEHGCGVYLVKSGVAIKHVALDEAREAA